LQEDSPENNMFIQHFELIKDGDLLARNNTGDSLLHELIYRDGMNPERNQRYEGKFSATAHMFKMLVDRGLDPYAENEKQLTVLDLAASLGNSKILDLFARTDS
jgi:ankyrin repeat protein